MEIKDYGIIISSIDFKENDKILKIYTKSNGLITAYAFGAKKSKKRFGGNLIPFNLSHFHFKRNKDYFSVQEVSVIRYFSEITKSILNIKILFNVSTILDSQKGHWDFDIFKLLYFLLSNLNNAREDADRLKFYIIFCLYILKKEGVINSKRECFFCNSKDITYLASDSNSIYLKCRQCINNEEISVTVDKDFISFYFKAMNPNKVFLQQNFSYKLLLEYLNKITLLFENYLGVNLEKLE